MLGLASNEGLGRMVESEEMMSRLREVIGRLPGPWRLRCKRGDLAVMVKSWSGNEGRIVRCVRLAEWYEWDGAYGGPRWVVDRPVPSLLCGQHKTLPDDFLRPLRGDVKEDAALWQASEQVRVPQVA